MSREVGSASGPPGDARPSLDNLKPARSVLLVILIAALLVPVAISSRSLWIDEAWTIQVAQPPTLASWWGGLYGKKYAEIQMPLYSLWIWCREKIVGSGEVALRASNLLWFLPAMIVLARASAGRFSMQVALILTAACRNPMFTIDTMPFGLTSIPTALFRPDPFQHCHLGKGGGTRTKYGSAP